METSSTGGISVLEEMDEGIFIDVTVHAEVCKGMAPCQKGWLAFKSMWRKCLVTNVYAGQDGHVRKSAVRTTGASVLKDIRSICLLEGNGEWVWWLLHYHCRHEAGPTFCIWLGKTILALGAGVRTLAVILRSTPKTLRVASLFSPPTLLFNLCCLCW